MAISRCRDAVLLMCAVPVVLLSACATTSGEDTPPMHLERASTDGENRESVEEDSIVKNHHLRRDGIVELVIAIPSTVRGGVIPATVLLPAGEGEVPLVVFLHSLYGDRDENGGYSHLAEALAYQGVASVRFDLSGFGVREEEADLVSFEGVHHDTHDVIAYTLENFPIDSRRLGIAGYSFGARVALSLVEQRWPTFQALLVIAPLVKTVGSGGGDAAPWSVIGGRDVELEGGLSPLDIEGVQPFPGEATVVYAADDELVPPGVAKELAHLLGARGVEVNGAGHSAGFYSDAPEVRATIVEAAIETFAALSR